jgi:hypothetical protein
MESFVDSSGKLLPLAQIAGIFEDRLGSMSATAKEAMLANEALVGVFDVRGIKVIQAFADAGREGFDRVATEMENARSVAEKYRKSMSGITGSFNSLMASLSRLGIAFTMAIEPALKVIIGVLNPLIDAVAYLVDLFGSLAGLAFSPFVQIFEDLGTIITPIIKTVTYMLSLIPFAIRKVSEGVTAIMRLLSPIAWLRWLFGGGGGGSGLKRDADGKPMAEGGVAGGGGGNVRGETTGTFSGGALGQLGIAPTLSAAMATAENTAKMAGTLEEIKQNTAVARQAAVEAGTGGGNRIARGVAAVSERGLLSAAERTALASEQTNQLLRQLIGERGSPLVFA